MPYITTRPYPLPRSRREMTKSTWFNMWQRKQWPYTEVFVGDTVFWYESKTRRLVWETQITELEKFAYENKEAAARIIEKKIGPVKRASNYYRNAPGRGFCLAYKVSAVRLLDLFSSNPPRAPHLGWSQSGDAFFEAWSLGQIVTLDATLDEVVPTGHLAKRLRLIDAQMAGLAPKRVKSLVDHTIRRDTQLVKTLKELCGFRCQFPGCATRIPKKGGGFYVEVAHIEAVAKGGTSRLGNLIVLCPNHHKEFDLGERQLFEQSVAHVRGRLNGKDFEIQMPLSKTRKA